MVNPDEAKGITVPIAFLPSKDEPEDDVKKFIANLKVDHVLETFKDQVHVSAIGHKICGHLLTVEQGFMGARYVWLDVGVVFC